MASREYDNLIRKANQRLARAQAQGFSESYEVRQLYLSSLRGNKDIVINKKGQLQFKRSANISDETYKMITKVATRNTYTVSGLKKTYKDFVQVADKMGISKKDATRRVMATFNEIKNQFEYKDAIEIINNLDDIDDDTKREETLRKVEDFLNKNASKYKYADDLKKAFDKKKFFKKTDIDKLKEDNLFNG